MILGMSGTRFTSTAAQLDWMEEQIRHCDELHQGACVGADEAAHNFALTCDRVKRIVVHPPSIGRWMMTPNWNHPKVIVLPARPYHERNRDIVHMTDRLATTPNREEPKPDEPLGGTWYTIKYARSVRKPVDICLPDGRVIHHGARSITPKGHYL